MTTEEEFPPLPDGRQARNDETTGNDGEAISSHPNLASPPYRLWPQYTYRPRARL